jgi:hypothetical protein
MKRRLRCAGLERYIPGDLLSKVLSAARHARPAWEIGRL